MVSSVMSIGCSCDVRKVKLEIIIVSPTAVLGLFMSEKPLLSVARPVEGLKLLLPVE